MTLEFSIIAAGLLVGVLVGLTSIGLGMIQLPLLLALTSLSPSSAAGIGLIQGTLMKWTGMWRAAKKNNIDFSVVLPFALLGIPFTALGVYTQGLVPSESLKIVIGITMVVLGLLLISATWINAFKSKILQVIEFCKKYKLVISIAAGGIAGFIVGLTSIGSGSLIVIILSTVLLLPPTKAVGTNLMIGGILVAAGAAVTLLTSQVDYNVTFNLLLGSIPGVLIGGHFAPKAPVQPMRTVIAILVIISGLDIALP